MSAPPPVGVDAALSRLVLQQRVAVRRAELTRAVGALKTRAKRVATPARVVRARPRAALLSAFAIGLLAGLASGRLRL